MLAKQNWAFIQQKDANIDEGKIFFDENPDTKNTPHLPRIVEAAIKGHWVLICPLGFPQYLPKLNEKLDHMRKHK